MNFKTIDGLESTEQTLCHVDVFSVPFPQKDVLETLSTTPVVSKGNSGL